MFLFSFHLKAQNISLTSPALSRLGGFVAPHSSPSPHTTTLLPQSQSFTLSPYGEGAWSLLPLIQSFLPPNTVGQPRSLWMGDENFVLEVRSQAPPSPNGSLYRNIEELGITHACLISRLLHTPLQLQVSWAGRRSFPAL
jgi:hypothetical protein